MNTQTTTPVFPDASLIKRHFPDVRFHDEIGQLLSEMMLKLDATRSLDRDVQIEAYETIIAQTVEILRWINRNTLIRQPEFTAETTDLKIKNAELDHINRSLKEKNEVLTREAESLRLLVKKITRQKKQLASLILGIPDDADPAAVKKAYREKVKRAHPDTGGDEDFFKAVTEALLEMLPKTTR